MTAYKGIEEFINRDIVMSALSTAFKNAERRALCDANVQNPQNPIINQVKMAHYIALGDNIEAKLKYVTQTTEKLVEMVKHAKKLMKRQKINSKFSKIIDKNVDDICEWVSDRQETLDSIMDNMSLITDAVGLKEDDIKSGSIINYSTSSDEDDDAGNIDNLLPEVPVRHQKEKAPRKTLIPNK